MDKDPKTDDQTSKTPETNSIESVPERSDAEPVESAAVADAVESTPKTSENQSVDSVPDVSDAKSVESAPEVTDKETPDTKAAAETAETQVLESVPKKSEGESAPVVSEVMSEEVAPEQESAGPEVSASEAPELISEESASQEPESKPADSISEPVEETTEEPVADTQETKPVDSASEPTKAISEEPAESASEPVEVTSEEPAPDEPEVKAADTGSESAQEKSVDLSALQGFDFGTSWSESKPTSGGPRSSDRRPPRRGDRPPRGDRPERKDRRPFKPGSFRKSGPRDGGESGDRRARHHGRGQSQGTGRRPYGRPEIPKKVVEVAFYPEDNGFKALCKALRISTITYELFDIARTILEKNERFYMIIRPVDGPPEGAEVSDVSLFVVEADGLPFLSEEMALQHALSNCLEYFFTAETKEVDPPKGSFSSIQKCGFTGELLGPPNYHRLKKIMADHHASRLSNMPYARFESRIESVKEEEVIAEWLEKMKTQISYTLKPEFGEPRLFEDGVTARSFVKANLSDKMVRPLKSVRLEGTQLSKVTDRLLKANLEFAWDRQKRFPLDTANLLRGRLRRQKFALYKKGSKGVSYVCAVKRRFRESGQVFSDPVQKLIEFLELNPKISVKDLPEKYLGFSTHAQEGEVQPELTDDQEKQVKALNLDMQWLLKEGYIAEYSDGRIFAHPSTASGKPVTPAEKSSPKKPASNAAEVSQDVEKESSAEKPSEESKEVPEKAEADSDSKGIAESTAVSSLESSKEESSEKAEASSDEHVISSAEETKEDTRESETVEAKDESIVDALEEPSCAQAEAEVTTSEETKAPESVEKVDKVSESEEENPAEKGSDSADASSEVEDVQEEEVAEEDEAHSATSEMAESSTKESDVSEVEEKPSEEVPEEKASAEDSKEKTAKS